MTHVTPTGMDAETESVLVSRPMGAVETTGAASTEDRIIDAAGACIARWGLTKTTIDDVAREAGTSRATTYRLFPGGRDAIVDALVGREVRRFFAAVSAELAPRQHDAEAMLVAGIGSSLRFLTGHPGLRAVLAHEPGILLPQIAFHRLGPVLAVAAAHVAPHLLAHLDLPDDDRALEVAELLVRVVLSHALTPGRHLDPHDEASVARLVRTHLLPALRTPPDLPPQPSPRAEVHP